MNQSAQTCLFDQLNTIVTRADFPLSTCFTALFGSGYMCFSNSDWFFTTVDLTSLETCFVEQFVTDEFDVRGTFLYTASRLHKYLNRLINFPFSVRAIFLDHFLQSFYFVVFLFQVALHLADFGHKILNL